MALLANRTPALEEVIRLAMEHRIGDLHVAIPAKVVEYDNASQTASVQPLLQSSTLAPDGKEIGPDTLPIVQQVPVVFPRAGGFFISFPVQEGDHVLLVMCERSIDRFMYGDGDVTDPVDLRMHHLADAVAYPGLYPLSRNIKDAGKTDMRIGKDGGIQLRMQNDTAAFVKPGAASQPVVQGSNLEEYINDLVKKYNSHTHPVTGAVAGKITAPISIASDYTKTINSSIISIPEG